MSLRRILVANNPSSWSRSVSNLNQVRFSTQISKVVEEITIPGAYGHISGKWYGPKNVRPIVGLHGWQDNLGTFGTLAPLLPQHIGFLALHLPGHGLSSKLPDRMAYHSIDYVTLLIQLMQYYKWEKISIIAHSMSSLNSFIFSSLFPDKVDMLISLDILKPLIMHPSKFVNTLSERLHGFLLQSERNQSTEEPPSYSYEDCVEKLHLGANKSINKEFCKYLLDRNLIESKKDPQKFYFRRDPRLKALFFYMISHEASLEMATRIKSPHLYIKARQSPYFECKRYHDEVLNALRINNPLFEHYDVDGTHHVHLNEAEKVSKIINPFIMKYRPKRNE